VLLGQDGANKANDGGVIREAADDVGPAFDFLVQALDGIITMHHFCLTRHVDVALRPDRSPSTRTSPSAGRDDDASLGICAEEVRDAEATAGGAAPLQPPVDLGAGRRLALAAGVPATDRARWLNHGGRSQE
jgi:hypothetical protein